jgi:hypothetical protein
MWGRVGDRGLAAVVAVTFIFGCLPAYAAAESIGEISRAQPSDNWSTVSVAGTASRLNGCIEPPEGPKPKEPPEGEESEEGAVDPRPPKQPSGPPWKCGWIAFATVGPGSSISDCASASRRWDALGQGVQLIWTSGELGGSGSVAFDLGAVALQYGPAAPLMCLSAVESVPEGPMCKEGKFGPCPPYAIVHVQYQLAAALLESSSVPPRPKPRQRCRVKHKHAKKKAKIGVGEHGKAGHRRHCRVP